MFPVGNARGANVALRRTAADAMPRQFGPTIRAPCSRASATQPLLAQAAFGADLCEAGGDDAERADAGFERFLCRAEHVLAGEADHRELDLLRDVGDARVAADAGDRLAAAVDRVGRAGEVSGEDVAEELAADRAAPRRRADHGDARRREESLQRRRDRDVVPFRDAIAVEVRRGDREANLDRAAVELAHDVEAGVAEDEQHRTVLRQHLGDELLDPCLRRERDEALEQAGADSATLVLVVDGERDLGGAAVAQPRVVGERDDASVETSDQRAALVPVRLDERLDELRREVRKAVEAQVAAAVGEVGEEVEDGLGVGGERRPQPQRRAVAEDDVFGVVSERARHAPPDSPPAGRAASWPAPTPVAAFPHYAPGMDEHDLDPDPLRQLARWFEEARAVVRAPEAMALATADASGAPSVRMVLLKGFDESGLVFYTNVTSRKGAELDANPRAALLLHWDPLGRQVRVEGRVERVSAEEADAYFAGRPRGAQIGAHASEQSTVLAGRDELERRVEAAEREFDGTEVPRPETWGGYRVVPEAWEFWQHRDSRLHDRFRYTRDGSGWRVDRLAP